MNGSEIRQALHAKGFTLTMLAEELGVHSNLVRAVIHRRGTSKSAADAIAKVLGQPVTEIFPDVPSYAAPGLPNPNQREAKRAELRQLLAS